MLHVWTLWTQPSGGSLSAFDRDCLQLSVRLVAARGHTCQVHTDTPGMAGLSGLGLPAQILPTCDALADVPPRRWAWAKLHTQSLMQEGYVHLDHDVFLRQEPPPPSDPGALLCQQLEDQPGQQLFYRRILQDYARDSGDHPPSEILAVTSTGSFCAYNCGYLRVPGERLPFMHAFIRRAGEVYQPMRTFTHNNNALPEQLLLWAWTQRDGVPVETLLPSAPAQLQARARAIGYSHIQDGKRQQPQEYHAKVLRLLAPLLT